ncbi:MAG: chemotaxis protein CheW, partial [Cyanobacteria bacterium P01_F01_bin.153]
MSLSGANFMPTLTPAIALPGAQTERSPAQQSDRFRIIAFSIGGYTLALPMTAIAKVIHCPPLNTPGLGQTGLIHLDQQIIRVLNLHILAESSIDTSSHSDSEPRFLVVTRQSNGNLCGIPVDAPPDLLEVSRSQVHTIPNIPNQNPILSLAQFAAVVESPTVPASQDNSKASESTVLFLNLEEATNQTATSAF